MNRDSSGDRGATVNKGMKFLLSFENVAKFSLASAHVIAAFQDWRVRYLHECKLFIS